MTRRPTTSRGPWSSGGRCVLRPPERGGDFDELMSEVLEAMSKAREYAGPGYLAYIPGGGLFTSALGEFVARGYNRFVGMWLQGPAAVAIEENVTRWLCDLFEYPADAQGLLTTGGSLANLSAVVAARHAKLGEDFRRRHVLRERARARAASPRPRRSPGSPVRTFASCRPTPSCASTPRRCGRGGRGPARRSAPLHGGGLGRHDEHRRDRSARRRRRRRRERGPVAARRRAPTAGSSSSPTAAARWFRGIERSDSVTLDPHKGLFLPYGTGALVVRDGEALRDAHFEGAAYLQDLPPLGRAPELLRALARALPRVPRACGVVPAAAARRGGVPRGARREARSRRLPRRRARTTTPMSSSVGSRSSRSCAFRLRGRRRRRAPEGVPRRGSTRRSGCSCRAR